MTEITVAIVTQFGVLGAALVAAWAARGAKLAAFGARKAAKSAAESGGSDHADQTSRLDAIASTLNDVTHRLTALRSDSVLTRSELHDLRTTLTNHLQEKRS